MATGPIERQILRAKISQQYLDTDKATAMLGLDLALRGFELLRERLDNNALDWEDYTPIRGHYNATISGILDALHHKVLTPDIVPLWKKYHASLWVELEEPAYLTNYCKAVFEQLIPRLTTGHVGLRALHKMLIQAQEKANDPKSMSIIRANIENNTTAMQKLGFSMETRALRGIFQFDPKPDFFWLNAFIGRVASPVVATIPTEPKKTIKSKGLQKCNASNDGFDDFNGLPLFTEQTSNSGLPDFDPTPLESNSLPFVFTDIAADAEVLDFNPTTPTSGLTKCGSSNDPYSDDAPQAAEPTSEPWEQALGAMPGVLVPSRNLEFHKPKGLQKCSPSDDISTDIFGM